jgi:tRNA nucleotidyltransferase (CCA-adding enzyme)
LNDREIPQALLERASKLVNPSASEEKKLEQLVTKITARLEASLERDTENPKPQVVLGGSYARETWLRGSHDVDFFLLYPAEFPREKLETVAIQDASSALEGYPINKRYAEHPYVESFVEDVRINIVPCYAVAPGEWQSAADRSPYHTKYIQSKLDERLRLEARLFKKFVKASGVYGAEVKIQGFSGYVCEVLTIKFGSFTQTLQALSKLNPGEVISIEDYDRDLAASFKSPVVILDPVDTTRNLGGAISGRNLGILVLACRRFLSKPRILFFLPKRPEKPSGKFIRSKLPLFSRLLIVQFRIDSRSPDILWGELRKSSASVSDKLSGYGYQALRHSAASDEKENAAFLFLLSNVKLEGLSVRQGPDYFRAEEVEKYFEKNRGKALLTWMGEDGKLKSVFERKEILESAASSLEWMLQKKNIDGTGVSSRIKKELLRKYRISMADQVMRTGKKREWLIKEILGLTSSD